MILARLQEELTISGELSDHQFGFRKGRSTIHAVKRVIQAAKIVTAAPYRKWAALTTVDVKNAFNSASWRIIVEEIESRGIAPYIVNCIKDYLFQRSITTGGNITIEVTSGVPQGSVLGPTLWNIAYDRIMELDVPVGVSLWCYADELAIVATADHVLEVKYKTEETFELILQWMSRNSLHIALEKTEVMLIKDMRRPPPISFNLGGTVVKQSDNIKYLGITIDANLTYGPHIRTTCNKAEKQAAAIARLMPNIGGPRASKRKVLGGVTNSILLYGAPIWSDALKIKSDKEMMRRVARKALIKICSAYRTTSTDALEVIAGIPPIHLLAAERARVFNSDDKSYAGKTSARETTIAEWQQMWDETQNGRWTKELIPRILPWYKRKHGEVDYFITQMLSGHGAFKAYTHGIQKSREDTCTYCIQRDTAEHTMFHCPRWQEIKAQMEADLGYAINKQNLADSMLKDANTWMVIGRWMRAILKRKESDEREQQAEDREAENRHR